MNYPKLKALKYKLIIPLLVFLFGTGVLCVVIYKINYTNQERVRDKAALNAVSYADRMIADLNNGITITKSLEQIIISENGQIEHFEKIAENMMKFIIRYVLETCPADMEFFDQFYDKELLSRLENIVNSDFGVVTYTDAVKILEENNDNFDYKVSWGIDLQTEHEKYLKSLCLSSIIQKK